MHGWRDSELTISNLSVRLLVHRSLELSRLDSLSTRQQQLLGLFLLELQCAPLIVPNVLTCLDQHAYLLLLVPLLAPLPEILERRRSELSKRILTVESPLGEGRSSASQDGRELPSGHSRSVVLRLVDCVRVYWLLSRRDVVHRSHDLGTEESMRRQLSAGEDERSGTYERYNFLRRRVKACSSTESWQTIRYTCTILV